MKSLVILANGLFPQKEKPLRLLREADFVVCCDGSAEHLISKGITPCAIVGDLDSLPENIARQFGDILRKESDQETNDLTKAFKVALEFVREYGLEAVHILGATGLREDHTLGNISLLAEYAKQCPCPVDMVSDYGTMVAIADTAAIEAVPGREVSIFAFDNSLKISSEGLQYPTDAVVFNSLWPATLNKVEKSPFKLTLSHPASVIIYFDES
ncbi:MAG: thiamine diphosphokinase [Bacteroidales bacterium]|nr:thiamine diphosphokinase [Bacteroidales bacterium]